MRTTKAQISPALTCGDCADVQAAALISAFAVFFLDSIIPLLAKFGLSRLLLASVAEQAGLSLTWSQTPKTGFLMTWLKWLVVLTVSLWNKQHQLIKLKQYDPFGLLKTMISRCWSQPVHYAWGIWARSCENMSYVICEQQGCRSACTSAFAL